MTSSRIPVKAAIAAVFSALIAASAFFPIPVPGSPVPVSLQNLFVMLAALLLGPVWGSAAVALYLGMGALGLPVFSGGNGGLARFAAPTGGFLLGFLAAAPVAGFIGGNGKRKPWRSGLASIAAVLVIYAVGLPLLRRAIHDEGWMKTLSLGFFPYIGWDALKAVVAAGVAQTLGPWLEERLSERED